MHYLFPELPLIAFFLNNSSLLIEKKASRQLKTNCLFWTYYKYILKT